MLLTNQLANPSRGGKEVSTHLPKLASLHRYTLGELMVMWVKIKWINIFCRPLLVGESKECQEEQRPKWSGPPTNFDNTYPLNTLKCRIYESHILPIFHLTYISLLKMIFFSLKATNHINITLWTKIVINNKNNFVVMESYKNSIKSSTYI